MKLRPANLDDIPALMGLQKNIIEYERSFDSGIRANAIYYSQDRLEEIIQSDTGKVVVIDAENKLMGCGFGTITESSGWDAFDKKGYVGMMYVDPALRGKGFGKKILEYILNWFSEKDILDVQLNVYPNNTRALELYRSYGFEDHLMYMRKLK
ncbi:MAG: GNAT family N-acetyltransferase [Alphaproteobacteria bacterium]|nr:GNAT family N-acetyltransferase [Alphaproteobacteria bacterium]